METVVFADLHFQKPSWGYATDYALKKFFHQQFWPLIKKRNIHRIIQLGDFTHDKKTINKQTADLIGECFTLPAQDLDLDVILICGNHDAYFRDKNNINSLRTLFRNTGFTIVDTEVEKFNNSVYIPWGFDPKMYPAKYAFGHFEIKGFEYQKGITCNSGSEQSDFGFFERVLAGHFHRKNAIGNTMYLGSVIALDFGEVDSEHGFAIFDDETGNFEFIKTEIEVFKKIIYKPGNTDYLKEDFKDKVISITVLDSENKEEYNKFLEFIYSQKPIDVRIVSLEGELKNIMNIENVEGIENILSLSKKYIDGMELSKPMDNRTLYEIYERIYKEAIVNEK
jgi:DNA repair exonuclease SbcCD nuclease subunit